MNKKTEKVIHLLEEKKAEDIEVLELNGRSPFFDEVIIVTAPSERAIGAFAEAVEELLEKEGKEDEIFRKPEGNIESGWVLVDGGDFILHILSKEKREELSLEELFKRGQKQ